MLTNKQVKHYMNRTGGSYDSKVVPPFPTINPRTATKTTKTADYTITAADLALPTIFDNTGDNGTMVLTLPAVRRSKGKVVKVHILAAQIVRLLPQTGEAVNLWGSAVVTKYLNIAAVIGNSCTVFCDGVQWIVTEANGVVTKEA